MTRGSGEGCGRTIIVTGRCSGSDSTGSDSGAGTGISDSRPEATSLPATSNAVASSTLVTLAPPAATTATTARMEQSLAACSSGLPYSVSEWLRTMENDSTATSDSISKVVSILPSSATVTATAITTAAAFNAEATPRPPQPSTLLFAPALALGCETAITNGAELPIQSIHPDSALPHTKFKTSGPNRKSVNAEEGNRESMPNETDTSISRAGAAANKCCSSRRILSSIIVMVVLLVVIGICAAVCGSGTCSPKRESLRARDPHSTGIVNQNVATFVNDITLSGRSIANLTSSPSTNEKAEERALYWLIHDDALTLRPDSASSQFRLQQRYALQTLLVQRQHVNGSADAMSSLFKLHECQWPGITCQSVNVEGDAREVVVNVNWSSMQLAGSLSADLGLLSHLLHVDLSHNGLSGSLPQALQRWTGLESLNIGFNTKLSGSLPSWLGQDWTTLRNFSSPRTSFTGSIPSEVGQWSMLEHFDVDDNSVSGSLPYSVARWTNLKCFIVRDNALTGPLPSSIGQWSKLEYFDAGWNGSNQRKVNRLTGALPDAMRRWTSLKHLHLYGNRISGSLPYWMQNLTALESMDLRDNLFTGELLPSFGLWTALRELKLNRNKFVSSLPPSLSQWALLEHFDAEDNDFTGTLPELFAQWTNLRFFSIRFNNITGTLSARFGLWTKLETLDVAYNVLAGSLHSSIGNWTDLQSIILSDNDLTGTLPESVGRWTNLTEAFNVDRNDLTGSLPASIGQWSHLLSFSVSANAFTGKIPTSIESWNVTEAYFEANNFTGAIPDGICGARLTKLTADCVSAVTCHCCTDCNLTLDSAYPFD